MRTTRRKTLSASAVALLVLLAIPVAVGAQAAADNPRIVELVTEDPLSPSGGLYDLLVRMKAAKPAGVAWLAGDVVAGEPDHSAALFELADYAAMQRVDQAIRQASASLPSDRRPILQSRVFEFTPKQSYNNGHVPWRAAGAFSIYFVELNTGGTDDYREQQRIAAEYVGKAGVRNEEWLGYSLRYGPESPAHAFITPMHSLSDLDAPPEDHGQVLPDEVDRARNIVLLRAVRTSSIRVLRVRPEVSSTGR